MTPDQLKQIFTDRRRAFQRAFKMTEAAGDAVLADLAVFCRATESCAVPGDRDRTFLLEGRREVWLRICDHLNLNDEQFFEKYTRPAQGAISHDRTEPQSKP